MAEEELELATAADSSGAVARSVIGRTVSGPARQSSPPASRLRQGRLNSAGRPGRRRRECFEPFAQQVQQLSFCNGNSVSNKTPKILVVWSTLVTRLPPPPFANCHGFSHGSIQKLDSKTFKQLSWVESKNLIQNIYMI